jgi:hypothetical protein
MFAKKSESEPMTLLDMEVFAMLIRDSLPSCSTLTLMLSFKYLTASRRASLYPVMMVVGCILFFISSFAFRRSSAAIKTTEVVPSPTYYRQKMLRGDMMNSYFSILLLGKIHEDFACRMLNIEETQYGSTIICNSDVLGKSIQDQFHINLKAYPDIIYHHLVQARWPK